MEKLNMNVVGEASKERFIAAFVDNLIGFALMMAVAILFPEGFPIIKFIFYILIYFAYFIVFEALWSRTLGKYFQGLIVRKLDGSRCDWKAALIRSVLRLIEINPILLGGLPAGLIIISSERKQRLGDIIAGTVVVSDKIEWSIKETSTITVLGEIMTLSKLLEKLDDFDADSIIYAERNPEWSADSRAAIYLQSENGETTSAANNLSYFLKVFIAKEVIEIWKDSCRRNPSTEDKCYAVIYYAENDAYIECP
jgi:uncharacterized RDD family membrane protein YckC